jgi:hypothetical protein
LGGVNPYEFVGVGHFQGSAKREVRVVIKGIKIFDG